MAICEDCGQEMRTANGCIGKVVLVHGQTIERLRYGDEKRFGNFPNELGRCRDCGCLPGNIHHPGCTVEECPICGKQLLGCETGF